MGEFALLSIIIFFPAVGAILLLSLRKITAGEGESQSCAHASACGVELLRFSGPKFLQSLISQRPASGRSSLPQYEG